MLAWRKKMEYRANFPLCATFVSSTRFIFAQRVINAFPDALNLNLKRDSRVSDNQHSIS